MTPFTLSDHQRALIKRPIESKIFLEGPAGTILVIVPQRTLATPYYKALRRPDLAAGGP